MKFWKGVIRHTASSFCSGIRNDSYVLFYVTVFVIEVEGQVCNANIFWIWLKWKMLEEKLNLKFNLSYQEYFYTWYNTASRIQFFNWSRAAVEYYNITESDIFE